MAIAADAHSTLAGGDKAMATHIKDFLLPIEGGLHHKHVDELLQVPVLLVSQALRVVFVGGVQQRVCKPRQAPGGRCLAGRDTWP